VALALSTKDEGTLLLVMIQQDVGDVVSLVTPLLSAIPNNPLTLAIVVFLEGALTPPHFALDVGSFVDDLPLMCSLPSTSSERMMDPMLIEALLIG
jgi:hypothetical protein